MRRRLLGDSLKLPKGAVDKTGAAVGDICISDGETICFMPLSNWRSYSGTKYQAIGVTVAAVGDCGDDLVRVCSIPFMNYYTPDVGSLSYTSMGWNGYNTNIGGGITETTDTNTAKADYNGKTNTTAILAEATYQPDWRTDSTIENSTLKRTNAWFPPACCCWRFHTLGTNQGDWYLPSAGELYKGYQNKTAVNASLRALGMTKAYNYYYWSSTSYSSTSAWYVRWDRDDVVVDNRNNSSYVRAFAAF